MQKHLDEPDMGHTLEERSIQIIRQGRLANQMFQLMLATELKRRLTDDIPILGYSMPEWKLFSANCTKPSGMTLTLKGQIFNLDRLAYLLSTNTVQTVQIAGWGMRLEYYKDPSAFRDLFQSDQKIHFTPTEHQLLINVRSEDIITGWHPKYFPMAFAYYEKLIDETNLEPVFMGQLDPSPYVLALREKFPEAVFLPRMDPLNDFQTIRQAKHIVLSVSSFSWLAAWLSETAENIHLPVCGLFDPDNREARDPDNGNTMLLPINDKRYHFYRVPFPSHAERKHINLINWATHMKNVEKMETTAVRKMVIKSMLS